MSIVDRVVDFVLEKVWDAFKSLWRQSKIKFLGTVAGLLLAALLIPVAVAFAPLVPYASPAATAADPLRSTDRNRVVSVRDRVVARLLNDGNNLRIREPHDIWTYGDILVGLGERDLAALGQTDHAEHILAEIALGRPCWSRSYGHLCHAGATAWALLALGVTGRPAPHSTWEHLLATQNSDGWWALYQDAETLRENASTYATAVLMIAAQEHLDANLVLPQQRASVEHAVASGAAWLLQSRVDSGSGWSDYPSRPGRPALDALSGMAIFALNRTGTRGLKDLNRNFCHRYSTRLVTPSKHEVSLTPTTISSGEEVVDHVRHLTIVWQGMGLLAAAPDASWIDQARIRRWFAKSLFSGSPTPEHELQYDWMAGEFAVLLRCVLANRPRIVG